MVQYPEGLEQVELEGTFMLTCAITDYDKIDDSMIDESVAQIVNNKEPICYRDELINAQQWSIQMKTYLDTAISNDEFLIYLQPKYDICSEVLLGAEALIRWNYRGRTFMITNMTGGDADGK